MRRIVVVFFLGLTMQCAADGTKTTSSTKGTAAMTKPAQSTQPAALGDGLYSEFYTNRGKIVCALEYEKTPMTVANFVGLAEGALKTTAKPAGVKFYDGIKFHRVIANFMIQGGDPEGTGRGGPGYRFPDEFDPSLKHDRAGILSMANAGPGTNGSQFFITHNATPHLDNKHSVFGRVVQGQDVVNAIQQNDVMDSVRIVRKGDKAAAFKADQASFDAMVKNYGKNQEDKTLSIIEKKWPGMSVTKSGMRYKILKQGTGGKPVKGNNVKVHYTGTLVDGTKFDSSVDRGEPFEFAVGTGMVIPGWDEALLDMKKGEKRVIVLPPELAYGQRGIGPIPPNSTLVFEVELIDF